MKWPEVSWLVKILRNDDWPILFRRRLVSSINHPVGLGELLIWVASRAVDFSIFVRPLYFRGVGGIGNLILLQSSQKKRGVAEPSVGKTYDQFVKPVSLLQ